MWIVVALAGTGCNQLLGIDELTRIDASGNPTIDSPLVDAVPIDSTDSPPAMTCAMLVTPAKCFPDPTGAVTIENAIDTGSDGRCMPYTPTAAPELCIIIGDTITIPPGGASITGTRPLLLLATTRITVSGPLDASSTIEVTARTGPGSNGTTPGCGVPTEGGGNGARGGGAGGTFITKGGDGGDGAGNQGHNGASATSALTTTIIRAGCRGSAGGAGGPGGHGGGAIYLVAGTEIVISNRVTANGAGGTGALAGEGGGGGGGSGGMIVLDAPSLMMTGANAQLSANGAGGGEGTFNSNAREGNETAVWNVAATGGNGGSLEGGAGGVGSVLALAGLDAAGGTSNSGNDGGGGGGGGGGGLIWVKGTLVGAQTNQISPPFVPK